MRLYSTYGKKVDVEIEVYSECKYTAAKLGHMDVFENSRRVRYNNLVDWEIVTESDAIEIERDTDGSCIDDHHEYLVLHFEDGETATFRNSYVDMFRVG